MDRRALLVGAGSAGAVGILAPSLTAAAANHGLVRPGEETWSESLMLLHFDPELRNGISVRVSRYPDMNATWVWCHVLFDGRMYAFTERRLPCSQARNEGTAARADYEVLLQAWPSRVAGRDRPRGHPLGRARSQPAELCGPGRPRRYAHHDQCDLPAADLEGQPAARTLGMDGSRRDRSHGGRQPPPPDRRRQSARADPDGARFDVPFTYAMMWGPTVSFIANSSPKKRYGDFEADGVARGVTDFQPAAPAAARRFSAALDDGEVVRGLATRIAAYDVPVYDRMWNGNIVRVELQGRTLVGMLNDWRPEAQVFAAA